MKIELSDQEVNLILNVLGDAPAKISMMLIQNIAQQVAEENKRRRQPDPGIGRMLDTPSFEVPGTPAN